jgi:hypothetical protein
MRHWGKARGRGGFDIAISARRWVAEAAARAKAKAVIERWNEQLAASQDMLWSSTIRAALIAGTPWLDVFCPGCGTSRAIDPRKVDRHLLASSGCSPARLGSTESTIIAWFAAASRKR